MADQQRINGNAYSWSSIVLKIDGDRFYGFDSITYGDTRERTKGYGMGRSHAPRSRTSGKYIPDPVTLSGDKDAIRELRKKLAASSESGKSFGNTKFEIVVQYIEEDNSPMTDTLESCVMIKGTGGGEEGSDALSNDIEIDCMLVRWDGLTLFDDTQQQV